MKQAPVLFKGIGHSLNSANNLAMKVLGASPSTYSANPKSKLSNPPSLTGSAISLVSVVQARNNARIMIAGSLDILFKSGVQKAGSSNKIWKRRSRLNFYKVVLVLHLLNEIIQ
ncbi:dolichyl-diphosphooligosaccharide--protein glycosyltransferase 48 kDa subunit-like isoform X2 [Camellia sinensis]|uniref:dolichyl-diphosphooligosaccharide--protein glycosyltransferase 48 kDa subunit-like isoform X2 n=1 Tax=Camellia sinensis TaxID=4442 RepID=UPI001036B588|nr:dolichyl-diphosphooligosaccharide--protein glycosyltransferase 48 kDa subunit-like isoform X2 [Camellia sinensis]